MKKNTLLAMFFGLLSIPAANAQNVCGTSAEDQMTQAFYDATAAVHSGVIQSRSVTTYIPVKFNLVGADENGFLRRALSLNQLHKLNQDYNDQEIHFYLEENDEETPDEILYNTIANATADADPRSNVAQILFNNNRDRDAVNLFIVRDIPSTGGTQGTTLGFYSPNRDWIVQRKSETNLFSSTLSHEAGHFFSLAHPHLGWESDAYGDDSDEMFVPAPTISPGGVTTEFADGSNCSTSGDRTCDTPADYNGIFLPCEALTDEKIQDPNGVGIRPMFNNTMSYFGGCGDLYAFTDDQKSQILANYNSSARGYLRPSIIPELGDITESPTLVSPIEDEQQLNDESVTLNWVPVDNAKYYLVSVARNNAFTLGFSEHIVTESTLTLTTDDLQNNRTFYWKVRPFNPYFAPPTVESEVETFKTVSEIVAVNDIKGLNNYVISPNPLGTDGLLNINLDVTNTLSQALISIRDITGKVIITKYIGRISSGQNRYLIDTPNMPNGVYTVSLESKEGIRTSKLAKVN